jgi:hypothetical protein
LIDDVQQYQQQMYYNMQVQQLNALELYGNNLLSTSVVNWFAWVYSVTGVAAILGISLLEF